LFEFFNHSKRRKSNGLLHLSVPCGRSRDWYKEQFLKPQIANRGNMKYYVETFGEGPNEARIAPEFFDDLREREGSGMYIPWPITVVLIDVSGKECKYRVVKDGDALKAVNMKGEVLK